MGAVRRHVAVALRRVLTRGPSGFDIDHLVPLNEAWQSGRGAAPAPPARSYANDLGYWALLVAVTAYANRARSDREPQNRMPEHSACACT